MENPLAFVAGDAAASRKTAVYCPALRKVAIQQGRYVGHLIVAELEGRKPPRILRYFNKGTGR